MFLPVTLKTVTFRQCEESAVEGGRDTDSMCFLDVHSWDGRRSNRACPSPADDGGGDVSVIGAPGAGIAIPHYT